MLNSIQSNFFVLIACGLLLSSNASAQINKCKSPSGATVYSDKPCETGAPGKQVHITENVMSSDGDRRLIAEQREAALRQHAANREAYLMNVTPAECTFKAYKLGDERGKALAQQAKQECIRNIIARERGEPATSTQYQQMWQSNRNYQATVRGAAIREMNAQIRDSTREMNANVRDLNKSRNMRCTPSAYGRELDCKPSP